MLKFTTAGHKGDRAFSPVFSVSAVVNICIPYTHLQICLIAAALNIDCNIEKSHDHTDRISNMQPFNPMMAIPHRLG